MSLLKEDTMNNRYDQQRNSTRGNGNYNGGRGRQQHVTNWNDPQFDGYSDQYDSRMDREDARAFEQEGRGYNQNSERNYFDRGNTQGSQRSYSQGYGQNYGQDFSEDGYGSGNYSQGSRGGMDRDIRRNQTNQSYNFGNGTSMRDTSRSRLFSEQNSYEQGSTMDRGFYGKGPKGYKRTDDRIKEDVCEALHDARSVDASDIDVEVKEGTITLKGTVETREAKREAERCIEDLRGVVDVRNEIQVKRQDNVSGLNRSSSDQGANSTRRAAGLS